ncbi:MAG: PEGA domain-containing protein [candidate division WOR-3 bacterium]
MPSTDIRPGRKAISTTTSVLLLLLCFTGVLAEKTCPDCGTLNPDNARFCKQCGTRLPESPTRPVQPKLTGTVTVNETKTTITSDPTEADVTIDGRPVGKTPLELSDLEPGRHQVTLTKPGYREFKTSFTIVGRYGSLQVTSDPVGAEILIDGVVRGKTTEAGLTLSRVPYGRHTVVARLEGYRDVDKEVDIKSDGLVEINFKLGWGKGFLKIESRPNGAAVATDERLLGQTPLLTDLEPRRYALTLNRSGFHEWTGYVQVRFGETTGIVAHLERIRTRKLPVLLVGAMAAAGAGYAAYRGETEYRNYQSATSRDESERLKRLVQNWDIVRNVSAGLAVLSVGLYWTLKW